MDAAILTDTALLLWCATNILSRTPKEQGPRVHILYSPDVSAINTFRLLRLSQPWHILCDHPRRDEYRWVWARTSWAQIPLEDRTVASGLIARLPSRTRIPTYVGLHKVRPTGGDTSRCYSRTSPTIASGEPRPSPAAPSAFPCDP